jgi:hypothetical protein
MDVPGAITPDARPKIKLPARFGGASGTPAAASDSDAMDVAKTRQSCIYAAIPAIGCARAVNRRLERR